MKIPVYLLFFIFFYSPVAAQLGCTDPLALNYDPQATTNDGSCAYPVTEYSLTEVTLLPEILHEASGLECLASGLFIHNDAGNPDRLYRIDSLTGNIQKTITIAGADNIDWEDITADETHIYIGDFGNNIGNRTDLKVYKIQKSELVNNVVNAEVIEFYYEDQVDFAPGMNDHNFDCEAIVAFGDSLHLFTKNWADNQTRHYILAKSAGSHSAKYIETFDVDGLITGADVSSNGELVLVGYSPFGLNFMWLLFDYKGSLFFSGNKRRIALGSGLTNSQTEGISFREGTYGYICSEKFSINGDLVLPQKMLSFSIDQWVSPNATNLNEIKPDDIHINVFPNPCDSFVHIETTFPVDQWCLFDTSGKMITTGAAEGVQSFKFNTIKWPSGNYFIEFLSGRKKFAARINKK